MTITFRPGRLAAQPAQPHLKFGNYLIPGALPAPPATVDWLSQVTDWPMYLNDRIGDCTAAGIGHLIEGDTRYAQGTAIEISDDDVLHLYEATGGYNPADPSTDQGAVCQDVLGYVQKTGIAGHKVLAFAKVDISNLDELKQAISIFGSVYAGLNFPASAMAQFNAGQPWDVVRGARIEGGHCVTIGAYTATGLECVTWGKVQPMTWAFFKRYFEEAWVVVTTDWLSANGTSPQGLSVQALGQDYTALTGRPSPFPAPQPTPVPTPAPVVDAHALAAYRAMQAWAAEVGVV